MRGNTDTLYHQSDSTFFNIRAGNGQRNTFRESIHADDDKMTGSTATGNKRSFNYELRYIVRKKSFRKNSILIFHAKERLLH